MILRFAEVLEASTDELLRGSKGTRAAKKQPSIRLVRLWNRSRHCRSMSSGLWLTTIDKFLASAQD